MQRESKWVTSVINYVLKLTLELTPVSRDLRNSSRDIVFSHETSPTQSHAIGNTP